MGNQVHLNQGQFKQIESFIWDLTFKRPARTSKSRLTTHRVWYASVEINRSPHWIEAAPLTHLSKEKVEELPSIWAQWIAQEISREQLPSSLKFAVDCMEQSINISQSNFNAIPINGLIWMNEIQTMYQEALEKIDAGFDCIKIKVGALDFEEELALLKSLREKRGNDFTLRLDANGAWEVEEALRKMEMLSALHIHSIEQPIGPGQWDDMKRVCAESPIPIALDEELIGVNRKEQLNLLSYIAPQFIVLKPTLHGGLQECDDWIANAMKLNIDWWATSALESNIGLGHIFKWLQKYSIQLPQGLGTGGLYTNNWQSPMQIIGQELIWNNQLNWQSPWS
jgi:o-succinylbenzoate synthase